MATIEELRRKANLVANATEVGENTAERVGGVLQEMADFMSTEISERKTSDIELQKKVEKLKQYLLEISEAHVNEEANERGISDEQLQKQINDLKSDLAQILGVNEIGAISSFANVISFLGDVTVEDRLMDFLDDIQFRISQVIKSLDEETSKRNKLDVKLRNFKDSFYNLNGGFLNITRIVPLSDGYYTPKRAISILEILHIPEDDRKGLIITFEVSSGEWEEYRYVGDEINDEAFATISLWERYFPIGDIAGDNPLLALNEQKRKENETLRKAAELARQYNEEERKRNEEERIKAELERVQREGVRDSEYLELSETSKRAYARLNEELNSLDERSERLSVVIEDCKTFVDGMKLDLVSFREAEEQRATNEVSRLQADTRREEGIRNAIERVNEAISGIRDSVDGRLALARHEPNETPFALTPNVMHVWGTQDSLELSLNTDIEEDGILAEYAFQFTCPSYVGTNLVLPANIKWYNDFIVVPQAGKTYQASIVNNIIIMGGV